MIFVQNSTLPQFSANNFTPYRCASCDLVCSRQNRENEFNISFFVILDRNGLDFKISIAFEKEKMSELEISVLNTQQIMLFLEKFTQLAKIFHCRL